MIKNATVMVLEPLLQKLTNNGVVLTAGSGTPVASLVNASYTPLMDNKCLYDSGPIESLMSIAAASRECTLNDVEGHSDYLKLAIERVSAVLQRNLYLARNVVNPVILSIVESVTNEQQQSTAKIANVLSVVPNVYEDIWNSDVLDGMVGKYKDTPVYTDSVIPSVHPLLTDVEIKELMKTGSARFDTEIDTWVEGVGDDFIVDVYRRIFAVNSIDGESDINKGLGLNTDFYPADVIRERKSTLVIHLMARRLKQKVLENIDMDLGDYEQLMATVIEQSGRAICRVMEIRQRDVRQNRMVLSWPQEGAEYFTNCPENAIIYVNGDTYSKWLDDGGKPEILFGSFITDRNENPDTLMQNADVYCQAWGRRAAIVRSGQRSDTYNTTVKAIYTAATNEINKLADEHFPNASRADSHSALNAFIETEITIDSLERLHSCIKRLVCRVMFPASDAEMVLNAVDVIGADNPEMDIREVALLAAIDILVKWVSTNYTVSYLK